ncbi:Glycosyl transferases group 1 [Flavobacterium sp. CF108]|uniref:glycosyltransferase n=1 Tax=unclassified Flavobacterium TaxID=196869 RepID=UPI0008BC6E3A|nr:MULTISPECIES: glycosyltransferase [unclassified Flavobacterium]SEO50056.1 Glycosyl transferases group 1 [Flavobacterium sp. fv08]SHH72571.1 Glycosyl transferases group 1 [Flavobacterium sp. CF108]
MSNILIYNHDIQKYPPIITAIKVLLSLGQKVVVIGYCSDKNTITDLESKGVIYFETIINDIKENKIIKFFKLYSYKKKVEEIVTKEFKSDSVLWVYGNQNIWLLYKLIYRFKSILYLFETPQLKVGLRYKILSPFLDYANTMQKAWKVVCCEYNRAHVTKAYFNLDKLPIVIPNKPNFDTSKLREILEGEIETLFCNKKVILYQGIFNYPERRLDELCQSINYLPEEYIVCIMGGDDINKKRLMDKYKSERVIFMPFISAPKHLEITKKAYIGFLSYFPTQGSIENVINTLYCAPNKVYEYSCFGVPMLSNDIPGLSLLFEKYNAGRVVSNFTPENLASAILNIDSSYHQISKGSIELYNSLDITSLFEELIS